ncbi:S28 family serine protease [Streptomyces sp. CAU 1734]|uniref:S28 family serine protease n=1 Tax=Streptomyces sp. CAU 1734 TaxID=3140360 RepID=UPI0032601D47
MRKTLTGVLSLAVLIGTVGTAGATAGAATAAESATGALSGLKATDATVDIKDRILAIPGMSVVEERPVTGYRFFVLNYTQPIDHDRPNKGTFQQRLTLLHKNTDRPTVFFTSGYGLNTSPGRSEPTRIVDGNQVSMEYRFFTPSRPSPANWSKLTIEQAANDQHRIYTALKAIYSKKWLATGGSKGGMTATYYERFHPDDMDGIVAYVAPNDVDNDEDSAYDRFFANVGTKECRDRLDGVQVEALKRREALSARLSQYATDNNYTFKTVGSLDHAFEATVLDYTWGFWQYNREANCLTAIPDARTATDDQLWNTINSIAGWSAYADQGLTPYTPYYYQAGTELGSPDIEQPHLKDLSRYGYQPPRNFVPREIPMHFKKRIMRDVDRWVQRNSERMMFVNGGNDPWSAEPFRLGSGSRDSYVYTAPGANHGANVAALVPAERAAATASILEWAGVAPAAVRKDESKARPLASPNAKLDKKDVERRTALRP